MTVEDGLNACDVSGDPLADDCGTLCVPGSINLQFTMIGGTFGASAICKFTDGSTTSQLGGGVPTDPTNESVSPIVDTYYELIYLRDAAGKLCVIDTDYDKAKVVANTDPGVALTNPAIFCEGTGSSVTYTATPSGSPLPHTPVWQWYNTTTTSWVNFVDGAASMGGTGVNIADLTVLNSLTIDDVEYATAHNKQIRVVYTYDGYCVGGSNTAQDGDNLLVEQLPVAGAWDGS
jgi:hypothetical protein